MRPEDRLGFAARVRAARERKGLTQIQLAEAIGHTQTRVSIAERTGGALWRQREELAAILGVPNEWLAWGTGEGPTWERREAGASASQDTVHGVLNDINHLVNRGKADNTITAEVAAALEQRLARLAAVLGRPGH
jgi:transcriptional regulator with XRE-family HTH domain